MVKLKPLLVVLILLCFVLAGSTTSLAQHSKDIKEALAYISSGFVKGEETIVLVLNYEKSLFDTDTTFQSYRSDACFEELFVCGWSVRYPNSSGDTLTLVCVQIDSTAYTFSDNGPGEMVVFYKVSHLGQKEIERKQIRLVELANGDFQYAQSH